MEILQHDIILNTIKYSCKALIKLCLNNGISFFAFTEAIKSSFVEVAGKEYGLKGRTANVSRIAIMTGLSRKEVSRVKEADAPLGAGGLKAASPMGRLLAAWYNDPDYCDGPGRPIPLHYKGDDPSFEALAKRYTGDIPMSALLRELERNGLVCENSAGLIEPYQQSFVPKQCDDAAIERMGEVVNQLATTICRNLQDDGDKLFERRLLTGNISQEAVDTFHKVVREQGSYFLRMLESWLFEQGISDIEAKANGDHRAGVGIFFFEERTK